MSASPSVEDDLIATIQDRRFTRSDVAFEYARGLMSVGTDADWKRVNEAIMKRWSPSAVRRIKEEAWRIVKANSA